MRLSLNDQSWHNLEMRLAAAKQRRNIMKEEICSQDLARHGFGWLARKAVAFHEAQFRAVADKIRNLSFQQHRLDNSVLTDKEANYTWQAAQESRNRVRQDIVEWLPPATWRPTESTYLCQMPRFLAEHGTVSRKLEFRCGPAVTSFATEPTRTLFAPTPARCPIRQTGPIRRSKCGQE